jgi:hypothetical protein
MNDVNTVAVANDIEKAIRPVLTRHAVGPSRGSESRVVPALRQALQSAGFDASTKHRLAGPIVMGRAPETGELRPSVSWAEADIAIMRDGRLVGIIESEHDLAWVVPHRGKTPGSSAAWRYTMSSIPLNGASEPFASYVPLERMAYIANWQGDAASTFRRLDRIRSDDAKDHNPSALPFFLVSEVPDSRGSRIIEPRMRSLLVRYLECGVS